MGCETEARGTLPEDTQPAPDTLQTLAAAGLRHRAPRP